MTRATVFGITIVLETDEPDIIKQMLEFYVVEKMFDFTTKTMRFFKTHKKIYNRTKKNYKVGTQYYELGIGWAAYILNVLGAYLNADDIDGIKKAIYQDTYRIVPFPNLRDYQNDDILHMLKYKFGLFTVQTGYGKTEVIATITKYFFSEQNKKILIVTPGTKARDEVVKRIKSRFGLDVSCKLGKGRIQAIITTGFMNKKALKDPNKEKLIRAELETFDIVLSDEVEYCINNAGNYIFSNTINATCRYAFSGTADKGNGNMISFQNGLRDESIYRNLELIGFFGPSLIYRMPLDRIVNLVDIKTDALYKAKIDYSGSNNLYMDIMNSLFTCPEVCNLIVDIVGKYKNLFIPINNRQNIISTWINSYFLKKFRILLVCGDGYIYYDLDGNKRNLTLAEACEYIEKDLVDVIPSTSSGFRALDFPNLSNILLISGKIAGSVLQQIGRVARQTEMTIITLSPNGKHKIPVYSSGCLEREKMILEYYKYCKINKTCIDSNEIYNRL